MKTIIRIVKAVTVVFLVLFIVYLAFAHPSNWQTTAIVAIVLAITVQLFYRILHTIKLGKDYAIVFGNESSQSTKKIDSNLQDKVNKLNQRVSKAEVKDRQLQGQINSIDKRLISLSKDMPSKPTVHMLTTSELLSAFYFTNNIDNFTKEQTPINIDEFHNTIQQAKKNNKSFENNDYYKRIVKKYSEALTYRTIKNIRMVCNAQKLQELEPLLYKATKYPYSKETILSIKDSLSNNGNKARLTFEFEQLIRNLDKLY